MLADVGVRQARDHPGVVECYTLTKEDLFEKLLNKWRKCRVLAADTCSTMVAEVSNPREAEWPTTPKATRINNAPTGAAR